jgi:anti-anti-sigma regulatory factor
MTREKLSIEVVSANSSPDVWLRVRGSLVRGANVAWLFQKVSEECGKRALHRVVIDLAGVEHVTLRSAENLRAVLEYCKRAGGSLQFCRPRREVIAAIEQYDLPWQSELPGPAGAWGE